MTRLKTEWIDHMPTGMDAYNRMLKERTGLDLSGLVMQAYDLSGEELDRLRRTVKVCAVPVTQGLGIIGSFSESVASIVRSMGFQAEVSPATDVEGIFRAKSSGAQVIFLADDERFIALNTENGRVGENDRCTALGYIEAARAMAARRGKELRELRVLQIGYGRVGRIAAELLTERGIAFDLYDKDPGKGTQYRKTLSQKDFRDYDVILDFTNEGGWIEADMVREDALYLSPGVPLSLTPEAARLLQGNSLYDQLEIGTAMMLGEVLI